MQQPPPVVNGGGPGPAQQPRFPVNPPFRFTNGPPLNPTLTKLVPGTGPPPGPPRLNGPGMVPPLGPPGLVPPSGPPRLNGPGMIPPLGSPRTVPPARPPRLNGPGMAPPSGQPSITGPPTRPPRLNGPGVIPPSGSPRMVAPAGPPRLNGPTVNGPVGPIGGPGFRPPTVNGQPLGVGTQAAAPGPPVKSSTPSQVPPGPTSMPQIAPSPLTSTTSTLIQNGHQRVPAATSLPEPHSNRSSNRSSRQPSPITTPQPQLVETQSTPASGLTAVDPSSSVNEGSHPTSTQPTPESSVDGSENQVPPPISSSAATTVASVETPVPTSGIPASVPHVHSEPIISASQANNVPVNQSVKPLGNVTQFGGSLGNIGEALSSPSAPVSPFVQTPVSDNQNVPPPSGIPMNTPSSRQFSTTPISGRTQSSGQISSAGQFSQQTSVSHAATPLNRQATYPSFPSATTGPMQTPAGPPPTSVAPLHRGMGPPASNVPPTSSMGPPPTSMGHPQTSVRPPTSMGHPPAPMGHPPAPMGHPPAQMGHPPAPMGHPPTSMGHPPTSMGHPPTSMGHPPTSMGHPPTSMGHPPTSMGHPPTSMGHPPISMGHPPTSMGHPPTSMGHPPSSMGPPPTSMDHRPTAMGPRPVNMGPRPSTMPPPQTSVGAPPGIVNSNMGFSSSAAYPPPPSVAHPPTAMAPPPTSAPPTSMSGPGSMPRYPNQPQQFQPTRPGMSQNMGHLSQQLGGLSVTHDGWDKGWGTAASDLLQQRQVLPPGGVVPPKPVLAQEFLPNCSPDIFRCSLTKIPETKSVLQKARLPFGVLIHPFKDLEHLPVVSCNTIVRCRTCRTYINPFVIFKGERRWECNLCFRVNELPEEFQYDPVSRTYGDPSRRPEVREATIEFIAPQEYMLRPPQPATYLWVLDVSRQAIDTGYLKVVCDTLLTQLDKIPGDRRTMIGFITFSNNVQFYLMGEDQKSVQMLEVGEIEDMFVPSPEDILVNLEQSRPLIEELLSMLPETQCSSFQTQSALGAALQAAYKLMSPIGGRITVMTTTLPSVGPGALKPREDPNQRAGKDIQNMGPATDFYKKLALDCSGQQIAVDLFALNSHYVDMATLTGISKFSGGCIHHFPSFHVARNPAGVGPFIGCLTRYITRKIGFEAVMRIRATRGLAITNFHGNFFVRSTDLLSLPNINPDAGFGMQVSIEEPLTNIRTACFQAALLYTSSRGERRIRVHTLCLPVSPNIHEVVTSADQQAVICLLAKMAVDRCLSSSISDARDALVNACVDSLSAFKAGLSSPAHGALEAPPTLQLLPLFTIALFKSVAFRGGLSTKLDDRLFAMCELKSMPLKHLMTYIYPDLYPIHLLSEKGAINVDDQVIPQPGRLHLSAERLDRSGAYLMDTGATIYIYVRSGVSSDWVEGTLGVPSYAVIPQPLYDDALPALDTTASTLLRNFVSFLQRSKPYQAPVLVLKEDNPARMLFIQHLVDDRTEGSQSYVEFLQYLKGQVK